MSKLDDALSLLEGEGGYEPYGMDETKKATKDLFRQLVLDSSDEMLKEDTVSASELMKIMRRRIEEL